MNNYNVPESAIDALDEHTSSDDGVSDKQIKCVANFIERHLFREKGKISKLAKFAHELFADRISDAVFEFGDEDDGGLAIIARMSITPPSIDNPAGEARAAIELHDISRGVILGIARGHFEEFADEARNLGWLK